LDKENRLEKQKGVGEDKEVESKRVTEGKREGKV